MAVPGHIGFCGICSWCTRRPALSNTETREQKQKAHWVSESGALVGYGVLLGDLGRQLTTHLLLACDVHRTRPVPRCWQYRKDVSLCGEGAEAVSP